MEINLVKLATELAHSTMDIIYGEDNHSIYNAETDCVEYKNSNYQNAFNFYYDNFYSILEQNGLKHGNI